MLGKIAFSHEHIAKLIDSFSESHHGKDFRFLSEKCVFMLKEDEWPCPGGITSEFHALLAESAEKRLHYAIFVLKKGGPETPFSHLNILDLYLSSLLAEALLAEALFIEMIGDG